MPTALSLVVLFLSSYAPLFALAGYLGVWGPDPVNWLSWAIAVFSTLGLVAFVRLASQGHRSSLHVESSRPRDTDAIGYVVTYILPFLAFGSPSVKTRVAIAVVIAVIAVLYVRTYLFYVNPLLALAGYRLFEVVLEGGNSILLLTKRRRLVDGLTLQASTLTEYVYLES